LRPKVFSLIVSLPLTLRLSVSVSIYLSCPCTLAAPRKYLLPKHLKSVEQLVLSYIFMCAGVILFFITITIFVFTVIATGQKFCLLQYYGLRLLLGIGVNLLVARASIFILLSTTLRRKIYLSFPTRPHVSLRWIMFIYIPPVTRLQEGGVTFPPRHLSLI